MGGGSDGGGDPGGPNGGLDEDVEHVLANPSSGGKVGADGHEVLSATQRTRTPGDLDSRLRHPDRLLSPVIVKGNQRIAGEAEVVGPPVDHAGEQSVVLAFQFRGTPTGGGLAPPPSAATPCALPTPRHQCRPRTGWRPRLLPRLDQRFTDTPHKLLHLRQLQACSTMVSQRSFLADSIVGLVWP